jgi:hypothetical protein
MYRGMIFPFLSFLLLACNNSPKEPIKQSAPNYFSRVKGGSLTEKEKEYYANSITPLYQTTLLSRGFNVLYWLPKMAKLFLKIIMALPILNLKLR